MAQATDNSKVWGAGMSLITRPSHCIYFILTLLSAATSYQILNRDVLHVGKNLLFKNGVESNPELFVIFSHAVMSSTIVICAATFLHMILIYASLVDIEDNCEIRIEFSCWIDNWREITIRYVSFILLAIIAGKLVINLWSEDELHPQEMLIFPVANSGLFFLFILWSIGAIRFCGREKFESVSQYLACDVPAFFHWTCLALFLNFQTSTTLIFILFLAAVYLILLLHYRLSNSILRNWMSILLVLAVAFGVPFI